MKASERVALSKRTFPSRGAWLASSTAVCLFAGAGAANAQATRVDPRSVVLVPTVTVRGTYSDNVGLSSQDRQSAFITRGQFDLKANVNTLKVTANLDAAVSYDAYSNSNSRNGVSWQGLGSSVISLVDQALTVEASGAVVNGNISATGGTVIDRSGVAGRTQVINVSAGPRFKTQLGDVADLNAAVRASYVSFSTSDGSPSAATPRDATIVDAGVGADTGERFSNFQLAAIAQYQGSDTDFKLRNAIGSVYARVAPSVRIVGRAGYEKITQPAVAGVQIPLDIKAPILIAGLELSTGGKSRILVEGGRRYDRNVWAGLVEVQILERLALLANYSETYQTQQTSVSSSFLDFINRSKTLYANSFSAPFSVPGDLADDTSYNKTATLALAYQWPTQKFELSAHWEDRLLLSTNKSNRGIKLGGIYERRIREDLKFELEAGYTKAFESLTFGKSQEYNMSGIVTYSVNRTIDVSVGYGHQRTDFPNSTLQDFTENVGTITLQKRFE